jgi:thiol:disulfide interchange protein DsbD
MKKITILAMLISSINVFSQILNPVNWSTSVLKISETEYELIATANIDPNWHLYSQEVPEDGPIPTSFTFDGNKNYLKKGNTLEDPGHTIDDPIFEMKIKYFENKAEFKQRIKVKTTEAFQIHGTVRFMVCDDTRCLPPTEKDLVFNIN